MSPSTSRGVGSPGGQAGTLPTSGTSGEDQGLLIEGPLDRKHDFGADGAKAKDRSWISLYAVIRGSKLYIYRDEKSFKSVGQIFSVCLLYSVARK